MEGMSESLGDYVGHGVGGEAYPTTDSPSLRQVSIEKELEIDIKRLEQQLEVKKRMQVILLANPAIAEFMNLSRGILK